MVDGDVFVVCGPTASGKSAVADDLSEIEGFASSAVLVDSMQVYREIPRITNQGRRRASRLSSVVSVTDGWSVADHRSAVRSEISYDSDRGEISILDAGTGMYLNASILDIPLSPTVPEELRERARRATTTADNPRRAAREMELELAGEKARGSIWRGSPLFETRMLYMRPEIFKLEDSIRERSGEILAFGIPEAERLRDMISTGETPNASVLDSIGVKELLQLVSGEIDEARAEERINIRTRRLAKRQIRWFDKLAKSLHGSVEISTLEIIDINTMHDIIRSWRHRT